MYSYVARQAILTADEKIHGYELLFRNSFENTFPDICPDQATSNILTNSHLTRGLESLTGNKLTYLNFTEETLLNNFPTSLDPKHVVIEILETVTVSHELLDTCRALKKQGYRLALDDHDFDPKWDIFLPYIDVIKVDVRQFNILQISKYIRRIQGGGVQLIAEKVETREEFEKLKTLGFELFQGYFFSKPEVIQSKQLSLNKLNLIDLIDQASKENLDLEAISKIVEKDVSLSFKLLRFINSVGSGSSQKIGSLKHALAYMGETELKKFICLLALAGLNAGKTEELCILSLIRAKFCEKLARDREDSENPPVAFLTGMFSLVDAILDEPMAQVATKLPLLDDIQSALIHQNGYLGDYLRLALSYEHGKWEETDSLAERLSISVDNIHTYYSEALEWANTLEATGQL
ncbi:EAL and HDOD domain-containing protein [Catenovulum maritimum]|uniref:Histidine kinase n=1 Tax=Catenovulum maritimum TaxID=1513271 RepID=A0A0J8JNG5_9ALTE|nr:EAL domain-containing protein [Catenovulum maritimum]KMT66156.1 histidine kinase [Catenovulum maritimum]